MTFVFSVYESARIVNLEFLFSKFPGQNKRAQTATPRAAVIVKRETF